MLRPFSSRRCTRRRLLLGAAMLLALLPRVFIPVGYMPDHASSSALRMCASGFPAALLAFSMDAQLASGAMDHMDPATHAAHMGHAGHDANGNAHCEFAALASAGLLPAISSAVAGDAPVLLPATHTPAPRLSQPRHLLPQARGPPALS